MPPVASQPFPEAIYNQLPVRERTRLARATGRQSAFSSASLLSNTLKNPAVVKRLPKETFGPYLNTSGQIKWWHRLKLTLRHFYHASFSNYAKLSKDFAKLVERLTKANAQGQSAGSHAPRQAASTGPLGGRGTLIRDFALNMGAAGAGHLIGEQLSDWRQDRKDKKAQAAGDDGGDSAVDHTGDPKDAEERRAQGREEQDEQARSESGDEISEADGDAQSEAGSAHDDGSDNDADDSADGSEGGGGLFGWLGGLFGGDSDGGGGD
ncbi:hypothetical protein [Vampirovibrio chlorellavorus]|uniref:hypothetical protein n=1 Tax=Vampirovibrio chlorellavorus TaxID=758823 RepID=UPI0026F33686|nr:hypothetical protein [Vampirovibrio chlorellavorus]